MGDDSLVPVELLIPDVIKIGVEGEEEKGLRCSLKIISKFRPIALCGYNDGKTLLSLQESCYLWIMRSYPVLR
jgi:hypothetical protein